jgi:hypothetical protein
MEISERGAQEAEAIGLPAGGFRAFLGVFDVLGYRSPALRRAFKHRPKPRNCLRSCTDYSRL